LKDLRNLQERQRRFDRKRLGLELEERRERRQNRIITPTRCFKDRQEKKDGADTLDKKEEHVEGCRSEAASVVALLICYSLLRFGNNEHWSAPFVMKYDSKSKEIRVSFRPVWSTMVTDSLGNV